MRTWSVIVSGEVARQLAPVKANADPTILPDPYDDWVLGDTYVLDGVQHLFLFHRPTRLFVPLARLKSTAPAKGVHRVDLHARCSRVVESCPSTPPTRAWDGKCTSWISARSSIVHQ